MKSNNTTINIQNNTPSNTAVAFKRFVKIKNKNFSDTNFQVSLFNKFLANSKNLSIKKYLNKHDIVFLFKSKKTIDDIYGTHYKSYFKVLEKPAKGNFWTNIRRALTPKSTLYMNSYESGQSKIIIEKHLMEDVFNDFDNILKAMSEK